MPAIADDGVAEGIARAVDIGATGQRQILDRRMIVLGGDIRVLEAKIESDRGFDEIDPFIAGQIVDYRIADIIDDIDIGALAAIHLIGAAAPIQDIGGGIAGQGFVGARAEDIDLGYAGLSDDGFDALIDFEIDCRASNDFIVAAAQGIGRVFVDPVENIIDVISVIALAADQEIDALAAIDNVVALAAIDLIAGGSAGQLIVAIVGGEGPAGLADEDVILDPGDGA